MTNRKIYVAAAAIIILCAALVAVLRPKAAPPTENGAITVTDGTTVLGTVSLEEIKEMPSVKRRVAVNSTSGNSVHDFRGTLMSNVLNSVNPHIVEEFSSVLPVGSDAYMSGISMDEVTAENRVYIMYEDNGEPIERRDGSQGGMRVVVVGDVFGQRFTNYLSELRLQR